MATARRVTVIAHELRGFHPAGGMGTATSFLALALARQGHAVEILLGIQSVGTIDPHWGKLYRDAGIGLREMPRDDQVVEPWHFHGPHGVRLALQGDPPDVVVAHDLGAPTYCALRMRQAGLGFDDTVFVAFCHGPRRYIADLSPGLGIGDVRTVLGVGVLEQAAVELADIVVSPSAYLLAWMRGRGWRLPERTRVIPYFTRAEAVGEPAPAAQRPEPDPLRRLAFFGRIDERKGVRVLADALHTLGPRLQDLELELVGKTTRTWPRKRIEALLPKTLRVTFTGELEQPQALERLSRAGTLVVMPSLQENSPNTVYECLERGIPFIASSVGGVPELIAPDDRERVLFEPTQAGLGRVLARVLDDGNVPAPPRAAFASGASAKAWDDVIEQQPEPRRRSAARDDRVDVVVVRATSQEKLLRCVAALENQAFRRIEVIVADSRQAGLDQGSSPHVVFLGESDVPHAELLGTLVAARAATGADVVTCGVRAGGTLHLFAGDPGGLGASANGYGTVALYRRAVLDGVGEADWPLLARLAASGASIVSIPEVLVEQDFAPGSAADDPAGALEVARHLERRLAGPLRGTARLAAGLAADLSASGAQDV
jgi:glycosyltransferase involved in cell wall biosynthesis